MPLYLHVRAGEYRFLVPADRVREVWRGGERPMPEEVRRLDCRALFGSDGAAAPVEVLVAGLGRDDTLITVDEVVGMDRLEPADFRPFPTAAAIGEAARLFDAVTARPVAGLPLPRWSGEILP